MAGYTQSKVILITGASSGIGAAAARLFGAQGWAVGLAARSTERLAELAAEIRSAGGMALAIPADLTRRDDIAQMVHQTVEHFGRIDVLVNNAATGMWGTVADADLDQIEYLFHLNVMAPLAALQAMVPIMRRQGGGVIINVTSVAENAPIPMQSVYAASKIALSYMSDAARAELHHLDIAVVTLLPGSTTTPFEQRSIQGSTGDFALEAMAAPQGDQASGSAVAPERVAEAILRAVQRRPRRQYVTGRDQVFGWVLRNTQGLSNLLFTLGLDRYAPRKDGKSPASLQADLQKVAVIGGVGMAIGGAVLLWQRRSRKIDRP